MNFILYLILAGFWGGSFIGIKMVVDSWPPFFGAAVRIGIALIFLLIYKLCLHKSCKISFSLRCKIWLIGSFSMTIPFALLFWGERLIAPGLAGIINGTVSIWTYLLSLVFLAKFTTFSGLKMLGLVVALLGVCLIFWPMVTFNRSLATLWGTLAVLMMAVSYAISALLNQHFLTGKAPIDFFTNLYEQHWAAVVGMLLLTVIFEKWPSLSVLAVSHTAWLAELYLGLFSTALAWFIYFHLIRCWGALPASTVLYFVPALALMWDYVFFHTRPHPSEIGGVVLILLGVILTQLQSFLKKRPSFLAR